MRQVAAFATGGTHGSFPMSILFMSETLGMSASGVGDACTATFTRHTQRMSHARTLCENKRLYIQQLMTNAVESLAR